ncbi:hypothetical protein OQA88_8593 [Cercophora sp. LCS_1]
MSLGSLMELLGKMGRWPLLTRHNKPSDVDLILEAPKPTGSFSLLWQHLVVERKRTYVTWWVAGYLVASIAIRLSVAFVGLAFNLNEIPGSKYPAAVTNWAAEDRGIRVPVGYQDGLEWEEVAENIAIVSNWAATGLLMIPTPLQGAEVNLTGVGVPKGLSRNVLGTAVEYVYEPREYRGNEAVIGKDGKLQSLGVCTGKAIVNNTVYSEGVKNGTFTEDYKDLYKIVESYGPNIKEDTILWTTLTDGTNFLKPSLCLTTHILSVGHVNKTDGTIDRCKTCLNGFIYECNTCITGLGVDSEIGAKSLPRDYLPYLANALLMLGSYTSNRPTTGFTSERHIAGLQSVFSIDMPNLFFSCNSNQATNVPPEAELQASQFVARVPALALAGAELRLAKEPKNPNEGIEEYVENKLDVQWTRAISISGVMLVTQLIAILFTMWMCKETLLRDHQGVLSMARLMKTMTERLGGRSVAWSEELAKVWETKMVIYGTRKVADAPGDVYEVDLWDDVVAKFPEGDYR